MKANQLSFKRIAAFLITLALSIPAADAALKSWDGSSSGNWGTAANWAGNVAPVDGDDLIFPVGAANLLNTNNINGLDLRSITFTGSGYTLRGNAITLTTDDGINGDHAAATSTIELNITLATNTTFSCANPGAFLQVNGDVDLNGRNLTNTAASATAEVQIGGLISGAGELIKNGSGVLLLDGAVNNIYTGITRVLAGTLELNDSSAADEMVPGDIIVSSGATLLLTEGHQIADTAAITINGTGLFNLNNVNEAVASLTFGGAGSVTTGTGTLTNGNITANGSGVTVLVSGNLDLGSSTRTFNVSAATGTLNITAVISGGSGISLLPAGITKIGPGLLRLGGDNTYGGPTTVSDGTLRLDNNGALGGTFSFFGSAATFVNNNAVLQLQNAHVTNEVLTLNSVNPAGALQVDSTGDWIGPITLFTDVVIEASSVLQLGGAISGSGGFTKISASILRMIGTNENTYAGTTIVNEGTLELGRSGFDRAIPGNLLIGDGTGTDTVLDLADNQISNTGHVTINQGAVLDLQGFTEAVGGATMTGATVAGSGATFNPLGTVNVNAASVSSVIQKNIAMNVPTVFTVANGAASSDLLVDGIMTGASAFTKLGAGQMQLGGVNTHSGLTLVAAGLLTINDNAGLGSTAGGTVVSNGASLAVGSGVHVGTEALTLNGPGSATFGFGALHGFGSSNSWAGNITLATDTTVSVATTLNLTGIVGGAGDLTKTGSGALHFSGGSANTYTGTTAVDQGTLVLAKSVFNSSILNTLIIGDGLGGANADVVRLDVTSQVLNSVPIIVSSSGRLDLNNFNEFYGSLAGSGNVAMGTADMEVGGDNSSTTFSGVISGTGGYFEKAGTGTMTLTGDNTYTGSTTISGGTLLVNGSQSLSPVNIGAAGILGGTGTVGAINNLSGGVVSPGTSPGNLNSGNATFATAASDFTVELNGTTVGTGYDRLNVQGTVNVTGSTLNVLTAFNAADAPASGDQFRIINNDGADAVVGTFAGRADNSTFAVNNLTFRIDYDGGTGNDVVLTLTNVPGADVGIIVTSGNGNGVVDVNECNLISVVVSNKTASAMLGVTGHLRSLTPGVAVVSGDSAYPDVPVSPGRRTNATPFQVSVSPNFVCGSNVLMELVLETATHSTFAIPFNLPTGAGGASAGFVNNGAVAIGDGATIDVNFNVAAVSAPVFKVTAQLHITHAATADLDVTLEAPDGTIVELTSDNGAGANYGLDCSNQTIFDDAAGAAITGGTVPFVGTFRPEGRLSDFRGKNANGVWRLHITDDNVNGITGSYVCGTINIQSATCSPGGGACELCPQVIITSAVGPESQTQAHYVTTAGGPSVCGIYKVCPGTSVIGVAPFDSYTFWSGLSNTCVTITLANHATGGADMISAAYWGSFNAADADKCQNYLADIGAVANGGDALSYSFIVPANTNFVVTVLCNDNTVTTPYTLTVTGGDCRPVLDINAASVTQARLNWTTATPGYQLERTNNLTGGGGGWQAVGTVPVVINSKFTVTNNVSGTNQFYRLTKP